MYTKSKIVLIILFISFFFLFYFKIFAWSQSDIEQQLRTIEQQTQENTNMHELMQIIDRANEKSATITGIPPVSSSPAETPEKEIKRRRDIINSQFQQARNILEGLSQIEENENPQIPEALPVEGYILINGGEKQLWYNNELKTSLRYQIRENFVGNLIVLHTYNLKTGKFEEDRDFELDTLSTSIKLENLAGRTCTRWSSGSPSICIRWASFILYEIDQAEIYPNFYSGVVNTASSKEKEIRIEANTPNIVFYAVDGFNKIPASAGCFGANWSLSRADFKRLLSTGTLILRKDIGSTLQATPGCISGSTVTLYLKLQKEEPEICKNSKNIRIEIIKPLDKEKYEFTDDEKTGRLILELEAKTYPAKYASKIEWEIPDIEGSKRIIQAYGGLSIPKGPKVEILYKGLPPDVESFGRKKVKARIKVNGCYVEDTKEIMIFYPRDAKNNPEGKYPNWFYYWKQTPAAKPFGQNVNLEFGGTDFDLCTGKHVMAIYKPDYLYKTIHICNLTEKVGGNFTITIPLVSRNDLSTLKQKKLVSYSHIDTFAVLVIHEFTHFNNYHTWWFGKPVDYRGRMDKDGDGIPDHIEEDMGFDPKKYQTHWGEDEEFKNINGDEEFLAYESTYEYPIGKFDEYDWGKPGKNWK